MLQDKETTNITRGKTRSTRQAARIRSVIIQHQATHLDRAAPRHPLRSTVEIDEDQGLVGRQVADVVEAEVRGGLEGGEVRLIVVARVDGHRVATAHDGARVDQRERPLPHHVSDGPPHVHDGPALGEPAAGLLVPEHAPQVHLGGLGVVVNVKVWERLG
jgi:hypothetical protein